MGSGIVQAGTVYVDAGAAGNNNGSSWINAYNDLQDALAVAISGDEIWVAQGTYKATPGSDRWATFQLINGVGMYGGFAGGETSLDERDWETNETILSGDLDGNDVGFTSNGDNSFHVVTGSGTDASAVLDGFTITAGNADGDRPLFRGGGMYNDSGSPTVSNCTFSGNSAEDGGGGMLNEFSSSPTVTNCTFTGNSTGFYGGGMYNLVDSSPTVTNCTFSGNSAVSGGGMHSNQSSPVATNCTFSGNSAGFYGGGMINGHGSPTVTNCTFSGNSAGSYAGAMYNTSSSAIVTNCTFSDNSADNYGGGMCNTSSSSVVVSNCTFSGNTADRGGGMWNQFSNPTVTSCTFSGNSAWDGGGMCNHGGTPTLTNCTFRGNSANAIGGGMRNSSSSPTVTDCTFSGNSSSSGGGMANWNSSSTVTNCTFSGNSADGTGGGMWNRFSSPTVTDCTFSGNSADWGGGMYNLWNSTPTVTNCILWGDSAPSGPEIFNEETRTSSATVSYSDVQGGWSGTGNIDADPRFVDADGPDDIVGTEDDDLRFLPGSPCIDAGDNSAVPAGITTDLDGNPRFVDDPATTDTGNGTPPIVDMGVYEGPITNQPPVADPGESWSIHAGDPVCLDGSNSFDDNTPSGDLGYAWTLTAVPEGSAATLTGADTATPCFTADLAGTYIASLVVTDAAGLTSDPDTVTISSENLEPTADAGRDAGAIVGNVVVLDGTGSSDPDPDPLTYAWSIMLAPAGSSATLSGSSGATPSFTPDVDGQYTIRLVVNDGFVDSAPDEVLICAIMPGDYALNKILEALEIVNGLCSPQDEHKGLCSPPQVTTQGNQTALGNFLTQAIAALQEDPPDVDRAISKLNQAIVRTDGCVLRGEPDGPGPSRDWITDCTEQESVYWLLNDALAALSS